MATSLSSCYAEPRARVISNYRSSYPRKVGSNNGHIRVRHVRIRRTQFGATTIQNFRQYIRLHSRHAISQGFVHERAGDQMFGCAVICQHCHLHPRAGTAEITHKNSAVTRASTQTFTRREGNRKSVNAKRLLKERSHDANNRRMWSREQKI